MYQVFQNPGNGRLEVAVVPGPVVRPGHLLIGNACSLISAGTERSVVQLSRRSLLGKARERPDLVRKVLRKLATEGWSKTVAQVRGKLSEPIALGYSSSGVVIACGEGVQGFRPGDRVASNGGHAEIVCVPTHLCASVPEGVSSEQAAFAVVGAIALQGVRLTRASLGETVFVVGLGLLGQITVSLLRAAGCRVIGTDLDAAKCARAVERGAEVARVGLDGPAVEALTGGLGADAVLVTAAARSAAPLVLAGEAVRKKGRVVLVGVADITLPRDVWYQKEAEFVVSCSYGPGRYDPRYEEQGHDYPAAWVRWTEQRNIAAVLDMMARGALDVSSLITHRYAVEQAADAYALIESGASPYLGVLLRYDRPPSDRGGASSSERSSGATQARTTSATTRRVAGDAGNVGVGCIGAGQFARAVLLPLVAAHPRLALQSICSGGGASAARVAERLRFAHVAADAQAVLDDEKVEAVLVLTRHHLHGEQVAKALEAGCHVFVEKPVALRMSEIFTIDDLVRAHPDRFVLPGFNRRFAPAARAVREFFAEVRGPITVSVRFNAGALSPDHWTQDAQVGGGRIIGEACHAIDLATFLTGSPPVRVYAESIGGAEAPAVTDDQCFITLRHANGSVSSIAYLAGGDATQPKERVEVLGGGRMAVIDDWMETLTSSMGTASRERTRVQDKGHAAEIDAFAAAALRGGPAPIPWEEVRAVSLASILAVRSLREGVALPVPATREEAEALDDLPLEEA